GELVAESGPLRAPARRSGVVLRDRDCPGRRTRGAGRSADPPPGSAGTAHAEHGLPHRPAAVGWPLRRCPRPTGRLQRAPVELVGPRDLRRRATAHATLPRRTIRRRDRALDRNGPPRASYARARHATAR